jgi:hypothetical protein
MGGEGRIIGIARRIYLSVRSLFLKTQHLDRVVLDRETEKLLLSLDTQTMKALEISGDGFRQWSFQSYETVHYPEFDICAEVLPRRFDIIIASQVFEHLLWPYRAGRNVHTMLEAGGFFLVSTPFLQKIHEYPVDCSRWSETGLRYLLAECGFPLDRIVTGSWGNKQAARANISRRSLTRFALYNPLIHRNLKADPVFPVQVWALAQKAVAR